MSETTRETSGQRADGEMALAAPSWMLLALLALLPPIFATGYSNYEYVKEMTFVGGTGIAFLLWGIFVWRQKAIAMVAGRAATLALLFGAYVLAASLWADNLLFGLWEALNLGALAVVVLLVVAPVGRPLRFYDLAIAVGVGAGLSGLMGILDLVGVGVFTVVWDPPGATGAFDAMEFATAYYVVALPVLLGATFRYAGRMRILFAACFLLAGFHFGLMATWTMAGIFAAVCAVVAAIVIAFQRQAATRVLVPVLVLLGGLAVFVAVGQWAFEDPAPTSEATSLPHLENPSLEQRDAQARSEVRNILFSPQRMESTTSSRAHSYLLDVGTSLYTEQPIVGHGAGAWWPLQTKEVHIDHPYVAGWFDWYPAFRSPHNGATKLLVEYGAVGLALFALWFAAVVGVTVASLSRPAEREEWILEHWALLTMALAGLAFLFFTPLLELAPAAFTWVMSLALLLRLSAAINGFRGWSRRWTAGVGEKVGVINPVAFGAAAAVLIGLGMLAPALLNVASGYYRGHADHLMLRTQYDAAIESYEKADSWYPAYGDVPLNIGLAGSRAGRMEEVDEAIERASQMRPHDVRALTLRGRLELGRQDTAETLRYARRAVDAFPNSLEARKLLIAIYDVRGEYKEAIDEAEELLERDPPRAHRAQLHLTIGDIYFDMLDGLSRARDHYEKAIDLIDSRPRRIKLQEKIQHIENMLEDEQRMREGKPPIHQQPGDGHGH